MNIQIENISKLYGKKKALDAVSLELKQGIYGLLGPNGAGKSTLLNIMVTALAPTSGRVLYNGIDIRDKHSGYLQALGFLPQMTSFYNNYTAEQFLRYMAAVKGVNTDLKSRIPQLLEYVNLSGETKHKIGSFSGGMKQRLGVAQALLGDPRIIIFDEPTAGLDPKERIRFRNLLSDISKDRTVILATHIVPDIEYIANHVVLLNKGKIIIQDKPTALMKSIYGNVWELSVQADEVEHMIVRYQISNALREGDVIRLRIVSNEKPHPEAFLIEPNLEDVLLYYTGEPL